MKQIPLIIGTGPGIDDAVAITLAVSNSRLDMRLITTVTGNVSIEATATNTLRLMAYYGKDVPTARGTTELLIHQLNDASNIRSKTDMEGFDFPGPRTEFLLDKHAIEAIRDEIMAFTEPIAIMPIGPLTNIALLLRTFPGVKPCIERVILIDGSAARGDKGVMAEFNIFIDPEVAKTMLTSDLDITMITPDASLGTVIPSEKTAQLKDIGKIGLIAHNLFQRYRKRSSGTGLRVYNACVVAYLLESGLLDMTKAFMNVEVAGELAAGYTVVDLEGYLKCESNATVTASVHINRFCDWSMDGITHCAWSFVSSTSLAPAPLSALVFMNSTTENKRTEKGPNQ